MVHSSTVIIAAISLGIGSTLARPIARASNSVDSEALEELFTRMDVPDQQPHLSVAPVGLRRRPINQQTSQQNYAALSGTSLQYKSHQVEEDTKIEDPKSSAGTWVPLVPSKTPGDRQDIFNQAVREGMERFRRSKLPPLKDPLKDPLPKN